MCHTLPPYGETFTDNPQQNIGVTQKPISLTSPVASGATATVTAPTSASSKPQGGVIAGSAIGGLVAGFIIAAVSFFVYTRIMSRKNPARGPGFPLNDVGYGDRKEFVEPNPHYGSTIQEAPGNNQRYELGGSYEPLKPKDPLSNVVQQQLR